MYDDNIVNFDNKYESKSYELAYEGDGPSFRNDHFTLDIENEYYIFDYDFNRIEKGSEKYNELKITYYEDNDIDRSTVYFNYLEDDFLKIVKKIEIPRPPDNSEESFGTEMYIVNDRDFIIWSWKGQHDSSSINRVTLIKRKL